MKLEVLLSAVNITKKKLDKMNIQSQCVVINQCNHDYYEKYKNFNIYSSTTKGTSKSRNLALSKAHGDIILFCDDDVIYNENYEKIILEEFNKNPKADIIFFNIEITDRYLKMNKKNKKVHFYNLLRYSTPRMAIRKKSFDKFNIRFNEDFGPNAKFITGEDTLFIYDCYKKGLKIYACKEYIGIIEERKSSWFTGYNEDFFFHKGALFTAISRSARYFLILQYLLRHIYVYKKYGFVNAYKKMLSGSNEYIAYFNNQYK